jgi:hypothetical protein
MKKKNTQCSLAGSGRTTALQAQGRCGFDSIAGSGMSQNDGVAGSGRTTMLVKGVTGS